MLLALTDISRDNTVANNVTYTSLPIRITIFSDCPLDNWLLNKWEIIRLNRLPYYPGKNRAFTSFLRSAGTSPEEARV